MPGNHDHHLVIEAKRGEQLAIAPYNEALSGMLPPTVIGLVEKQRDTTISDDEHIRTVDMGYEWPTIARALTASARERAYGDYRPPTGG